MKLEVPPVEKFERDAMAVIQDMKNHGLVFNGLINLEIIKLAITRALLMAYSEGANTTLDSVLDDVEQKIQLIRSQPITKA